MKGFLFAIILATSTVLSGCAGTPGPGGTTAGPDATAIIAQVQNYTKLACGFVPTAATIINILGSSIPGVSATTAVAQAICAAIAPPMMAGRNFGAKKTVKGWNVTPGAVNGVVIEGQKG